MLYRHIVFKESRRQESNLHVVSYAGLQNQCFTVQRTPAQKPIQRAGMRNRTPTFALQVRRATITTTPAYLKVVPVGLEPTTLTLEE